MPTHNLKLWLRATALISCLFMLSASFYAWGSMDKIIPSSGTIIYGAPISNATLRFKSSFESPVTIAPFQSGQHTYMYGEEAGYNWDDIDHNINFVAEGSYPNHIYTEISTVRSKSGTRSLYGKVIDEYSATGGWSRFQINVFMDDETGGASAYGRAPRLYNMSTYYVSWWVYYPSTLDIQVGGWFGIFEDREWNEPQDFANLLYIYRDSISLYWGARGATVEGTQFNYWTAANREVAIPKGQWFRIEVYVERHASNGVFKVWVDGVQIFNLNNVKTKLGGNLHHINPFKMYGGFGTDYYPIEQWADDLEIWDGMP